MQIRRNSLETAAGPSDWFTGAIYTDTAATPPDASRLARVSTSPPAPAPPGTRARTGQTIWVTQYEAGWIAKNRAKMVTAVAWTRVPKLTALAAGE